MTKKIKCACGCTFEYNLRGDREIRKKKKEWLELQACPRCRIFSLPKDLETELLRVEALYNLPCLTGSINQIEWAQSIRSKYFSELSQGWKGGRGWCGSLQLPKIIREKKYNARKASRVNEALHNFAVITLTQKREAAFWIEHRHSTILGLIHRDLSLIATPFSESSDPRNLVSEIRDQIQKDLQHALAATMVLKSESAKDDLLAKITIARDEIIVAYPVKSEIFIEIIKGLSFRWNKVHWWRCLNAGEAANEAAAEVAQKLLTCGFNICAIQEIAQKALLGCNGHDDAGMKIGLRKRARKRISRSEGNTSTKPVA